MPPIESRSHSAIRPGIVGANTRSVELLRLGDSVVGAYRTASSARVFSQNRDGQALQNRTKASDIFTRERFGGRVALNLLNPITFKDRMRRLQRPFLSFQWHYSQIARRMRGPPPSQNTIVAVLDTGVKYSHPTFCKISSDSYDFISRSAVSGDGDG